LPKDITFISTKELEKLYPSLSRKEREREITKKYGNGYSPHKAQELKSRLKEVDKIKAEIVSYIENRGLYEKNNISRS
jgi:asparagine synthetase A